MKCVSTFSHRSEELLGLLGGGLSLTWPPRPPALTPFDFLLWGYIKGAVYVLPIGYQFTGTC
jgi:hypothetical protein